MCQQRVATRYVHQWALAILLIVSATDTLQSRRRGDASPHGPPHVAGGVAADAPHHQHPLPLANLRMCYLCFGSVSDLGWTFTYNAGRLRIHDALVDEFPNTTFVSTPVQNFYYETDKRRMVTDYIGSGCNVILTNNDQLLGGRAENDYFAQKFPEVHFILLGENWLADHTFPNRVYVANDYTGGYYAAGAAAGVQATRCIVYFSAWDTEVDPTSSFAGFLLGVRSKNATMPVHVISQDSWNDPDSDRVLTDLFVNDAMCDVVARYSDPFTVDVEVNRLGSEAQRLSSRRDSGKITGNSSNSSGGPSSAASSPGKPLPPPAVHAFSIGCHSNLQEYVGDTVLTSVYVDWSVVLLPALRSLVVNGTLNQGRLYFPGLAEGAITLSPASPLASRAAARALEDSAEFVKAHGNVVCGPIRLRNGGYLAYDGGAQCKVPHSNIGDFVTDAFAIQHPTFVAASTCDAGHAYRYTFEGGTLALKCTTCKPDTYAATAGSPSCVPCAPDEWAPAGSRSCVKRVLLSGGALAAVVIGSIVCVVCLFGAVHWWRSIAARNKSAPRHGPLCLLYTDIEGCAAVRKLQPETMSRVAKRHDEVVRAVLANNDAYEVGKHGYGFVVATQSPVDAMIVAVEIQRAMMAVVWPPVPFVWPNNDVWNGPRVSIGLHHCRDGEDTVVSYNTLEQRFTYSGRDPMAAARLGALAQGGQIAITQDTLDALMLEPHYELLLAQDICIRLWSTDCPLYPSGPTPLATNHRRRPSSPSSQLFPGHFSPTDLNAPPNGDNGGGDVEETAMLYSVTPSELAARCFQSCSIGFAPMDPNGHSASHRLAMPGLSIQDDPNTDNSNGGGGRGGGEGPHQLGALGWAPPGDELNSALSSGRASATAATNVLVRLLGWVGVTHRKPLVHMLLQCLSRSARDHNQDDHLDNISCQFKNPKRLAAAVAAEIVLQKQPHNPLLVVHQRHTSQQQQQY